MSRLAAVALLLGLGLAGGGCATGPNADADAAQAADANADLGIDYLRKSRNEQALDKLKRALSFEPDHVRANWGLGIVYARLESFDRADTHFQRALASTDSPAILNSYGAFLCDRGRVDEAISRFDRAAKHPEYTTPAVALSNAGICLARAGRDGDAESFLRRALDADPAYGAALAQMARLTFRRGDHMSARAFVQRREGVAELPAELLLLAARNELAMGERGAAQRYLRRYNDAAPDEERTMDQLTDESDD
ncbi:type IV pilus biogenesis/stability protein PilW [Salinisphaera sp. P385]|uniref:Type IV pilus biogenesis/stability protein PilW n=1 Tax=Spectribacter acetivorans TaxID=3075603 RepID=A0ABU3B9J8_9GAMM|nr:type IV pilus biogenesis/stability protein PilW [Salinisphaera sp. P385]MDT0619150.1 type IV pilus biogenesis/stability protein PilW [Salinisphaera sp. P385]